MACCASGIRFSATVHNAQLKPGLLQDFRIALGCRSFLKMLRRHRSHCRSHFGPAQIVVGMPQIGFQLERDLNQFFRLSPVVPLDGQHTKFVARQIIVGINFQFLQNAASASCGFPALRNSEPNSSCKPAGWAPA